MRLAAFVTLALVACSSPEAPQLELRGALPDYGPLVGGTVIALAGDGFTHATRVSIGGREAPFVRMLDDNTLEVVIPPGTHPGEAEVVAFGASGTASARGIFRYSTPPTIASVTPSEVLYSSADTQLTLTGTGFLDDGAGRVYVLVDGVLASDVHVVSDTELTFTAPPGPPLVRPNIEVIDDRGTGTFARAYRYRPSMRNGILLFPTFNEAFAHFFDPVDGSTTAIPFVTPLSSHFRAVVRGTDGDFWGFDRSGWYGRIDARTTTIPAARQLAIRVPTITNLGGTYYAIDRLGLRIGRFDLESGVFTPIGPNVVPCCGSFGLASDGTTLYFTARTFTPNGGRQVTINTFDPDTGALGTPVVIQSSTIHIEEMRFFEGTLYAATHQSPLVTIDPSTGAVEDVAIPFGRYKAMEVFE